MAKKKKKEKTLWDHLKGVLSIKNITLISEEADDLHARATALTLWALILLGVASLLNLVSAGAVNIFLALALNGVVLVFGTRPRIVAAVGAAGIPAGDGEVKERVKKALDKYFNALFTFLLWGTLFLLVAGKISFANHPMSIPVLLVALLLLTWINLAWGFTLKYAKKIIYGFTLVMLILSFALLMPRAEYIQLFGGYPLDFLTVSAPATKVAKINNLNQRNIDARNKSRLVEIENQIKSGKTIAELSPDDQKFLREQTQKRDKSELPAVIGNKIKSLFTKKPPPPPKTVKPENVYTESIIFQHAGQREGTDRSFNPGDDVELRINGSVWKDLAGDQREILSGCYRKRLQAGGKLFFEARGPASIVIIQH